MVVWHTDDFSFYRQYGYVPFGVLDTQSVGRQTREGSRTLEVKSLVTMRVVRHD